jgi:hypothetical protein
MCRVVCDGHCSPTSSTGLADVGSGVARVVGWLASHVVGPALLVGAVAGFRWLTGAPMIPSARPWTRPRWVTRIRWHAWPRWQRAITRIAATTVLVCGILWPAATGVVVASLVGTVTAAAVAHRRGVRQQTDRPLKVRAVIAQTDRPAVEAQPVRASDLLAPPSRVGERWR